jgi:transcriptional regulator with XRE-family HTH domain
MHERIDYLIAISGISARLASSLAGLNPTFISRRKCSPKTIPRADFVIALAKVFGTSAEWLFAGLGEAPTPEHVRASVEQAKERLAKRDESGRAA